MNMHSSVNQIHFNTTASHHNYNDSFELADLKVNMK